MIKTAAGGTLAATGNGVLADASDTATASTPLPVAARVPPAAVLITIPPAPVESASMASPPVALTDPVRPAPPPMLIWPSTACA